MRTREFLGLDQSEGLFPQSGMVVDVVIRVLDTENRCLAWEQELRGRGPPDPRRYGRLRRTLALSCYWFLRNGVAIDAFAAVEQDMTATCSARNAEHETLQPVALSATFNPGSASADPSGDRPVWKLIWDTKVPPKLKNFAWQVASGSLPTDAEKKRRHFDLNGFCQVCDREQESSFHALLACPHAANLWDTMRLYWPLPDRLHINYTGKEWLFNLLDEAQVSVRSRIIMVLWRSWYVRNEIVHGKTPPPQDVSSAFLQSYHNTFSQISSSVEDIIKGKLMWFLISLAPHAKRLQAYRGHARQKAW
ncbi:retrotransposon unclassified [Hordeum vulgare]|nr:retrotransposon unclassified [Hordeum vulgare]